jgi:hypothetical protein
VDAAWVDGASAQKGNELQGGPPHYGLTRSSQRRRTVMIDMVYWLIWLLWYKAVRPLGEIFLVCLGVGSS